jgi:hypothetical protein
MSDTTFGVAGEALDKYWERIRVGLVAIVAGAALIACTPDTDHWPIFLPPPHNTWPPPAARHAD